MSIPKLWMFLSLFLSLFSGSYADDTFIYQGFSFRSSSSEKATITVTNKLKESVTFDVFPNEKVAFIVRSFEKQPIDIFMQDKRVRGGFHKMRNQRSFHIGVSDRGLAPPAGIGNFDNKYFFMKPDSFRIIKMAPAFFVGPFTVSYSF